MWIPFVLLIIKELFSGIAALIAIKNTGEVHGADWHGKVTTVLLYSMAALHVLWADVPVYVSHLLVSLCVIMMLISFVLYIKRSVSMTKKAIAQAYVPNETDKEERECENI